MLVLLVVFNVLLGVHVNAVFCPPQKETATPRFTTELGASDWVRYDHFVALLCCAEGYDGIQWYQMNDNIWTPFPPSNASRPDSQELGQVLEFYEARLSDEALYRCNVIKDGSVVLNHTVQLYVVNCDTPSEGPKVTEPAPLNQTIDKYGVSVTIYCTGYFGCQDDTSTALALWSVRGSTQYITSISTRYHVECSQGDHGAIKQATLTISPVMEEDTEQIFLCTVASNQVIRGQTHIPVTITKLSDKPSWLEVELIIGGCVGFIVIIVMIVLCLRCLCGPQVRLFFNRIVPKFGPKYIEDKNIVWNLYIYHADEDESIATQWKNVLERFGYKVRIHADMKSGQSRMNDFKEATTKSALVVFLYSENLLDDEMANLLLTTVVMERNGKDIMFLEKTDFKPKEIRDWAREAKHLHREAHEDNGVTISIEEDADDVRDDNTEDGTQKIDDLKFWKIIPRFKVPKDGASKRVKTNFVCSLRNNIPRFREQEQKEQEGRKVGKDRSGSGKPLLAEEPPESPLSPAGFVNNSLEMSPNMSPDEANTFDFDETSVLKVVDDKNINNSNGTRSLGEFQNHDNDVNENPHDELYLAREPQLNKTIVTDAVVHEAEINNTTNYNKIPVDELKARVSERVVGENVVGKHGVGECGVREHVVGECDFRETSDEEPDVREHGVGECGVRVYGVSEAVSTEHIFSMSGEEEPQIGSLITELAFTSSCEESKGDNLTSDKDEMSSQNASSILSSSGFGSQSSEASSPPIITDQSLYPKEDCHQHTNIFPEQSSNKTLQPWETTNRQIDVKDNPSGRGAPGKDGKNLKVTINDNKKVGSSSSPESGYSTMSPEERYSSAGVFLH